MNYKDPLQENLLDELARLVGRPTPVVQEALARLLGVLLTETDADAAEALSPFPMTSWCAIAPDARMARGSWEAVRSAGLGLEESYTALAVVDDHVRRYYGNDAWRRQRDWTHRLALRYDIAMPAAETAAPVPMDAGLLQPTG